MSIEERNKSNAQRSTGPRTEEGKATSSLNAIKSGIYAVSPVIPGEDPAVHEAHVRSWHAACEPLNDAEKSLVDDIADKVWRIRRASRWETRILSDETPDIKSLNTMSLHASRLQRNLSSMMKEFKGMHRENLAAQKARRAARSSERDDAIAVHTADRILGRESTLETCGFVSTPEELDRQIEIKEHIQHAKDVIWKYNDENDTDEFDDDEDELDAA